MPLGNTEEPGIAIHLEPKVTGYSYANAIIDAGAGALVNGQKQITASYSGDTNYAAAAAAAPAIQYTSGFTIAASSSTLTLSPGASSGNTVVFTVTPRDGTALAASPVKFSCPPLCRRA